MLFLNRRKDFCEKICLINNAASLGKVSSLTESTMEDLQGIFQLNSITPIWTSSWALKKRKEVSVINISSGAARSAYKGWGEYCSTKAALKMASEIHGLEQSDSKQKRYILLLEPGVVDTPMQKTKLERAT